jgi:hypothetical protein
MPDQNHFVTASSPVMEILFVSLIDRRMAILTAE